jgi:drug/metabolite transporter (DMT)-like permease
MKACAQPASRIQLRLNGASVRTARVQQHRSHMSTHVTSGRWQLGLALTLVTTVLWSTLPIALKLLLQSMDAQTLTWYRFLFAALVLGPWLAWRRRLPRLELLGGRGRLLLGIVVFGLCGNYLLYLLGLEMITPSAAQVVIQLAPLFLALGGLAFFGERFSRSQWLGFALVITGLAVFFHARLTEIFGLARFGYGVLCVVGAAFSWGAYALAQKQLLSRWRSDVIMWSVYVTAIVIFLPGASPGALVSLSPVAIVLLLYACLNTLIAYGCFAEALAHWEASRVSAVLAITPLMTIAVMRMLTGLYPELISAEPLDGLSLIGAVVLVFGSVLTATRRAPRRPADVKNHD